MSYTVNIPLEGPLRFPDLCPYTGQPSPTGRVKLQTTKTAFALPVPGVGLYNRYRQSGLSIPVKKSRAVMFFVLQLLPMAFILGGIGLCVWLNDSPQKRIGAIALVLGFPLGLFAFIFRCWFFRKVRVSELHESHLEVQFSSENYARRFGELNHLPVLE